VPDAGCVLPADQQGESLPGFLLRLPCRLGLPPARLAELTELMPPERGGASLPVTCWRGSPGPASRTFTFMAPLDDGCVAQLGMSAWQGRYPPLVVRRNTAPQPAPADPRPGDALLAPTALPETDPLSRSRSAALARSCPRRGWPGCTPPSARPSSSPAEAGTRCRTAAGPGSDQVRQHRPASHGLIALQGKILGLLGPGGPVSTLSAGQPPS